MKNNGLTFLKDELKLRGVKFTETAGIRQLKNLLVENLNGCREFTPQSALIIKAIKEKKIV